MKVAFISTNEYVPWGGSEELWSQTAIRMAQRGFNVGVSIKGWKPEAKNISEIEKSGCTVMRRSPKTRLQRLTSKIYDVTNEEIFLNSFKPDIAVISQGNNVEGLNWMEVCILKNIPFCSIAHSAAEDFWPSDEIVMRLAQAYQTAQRCFFVSHANLKLTEKQLAIQLKNAKVIANPFNISYDVVTEWPSDSKVLKLACVGRLEPVAKGQDLLFEVFRLDKWKNRSIEISLFGRGGNQQSLSNLKQLWNVKNINLSGFTDDVESIWRTHHALILPSRYEGLPLVLVEAMLCARLCIVTDIGGNSELIQDGMDGFIAKFPTADCIDEALEQAWQQRCSWYEMGQAASLNVRKVIPKDPIGIFVDELLFLLNQ